MDKLDTIPDGKEEEGEEKIPKVPTKEDFAGRYEEEDVLPYGMNIGGAEVLEGDTNWVESILVIEDCMLIALDKMAWQAHTSEPHLPS